MAAANHLAKLGAVAEQGAAPSGAVLPRPSASTPTPLATRVKSRNATAKVQAARAARAASRQQKLMARRPAAYRPSPLGDTLTPPEEFSVSDAQLNRYIEEADEMLAWARLNPLTAGLNLKKEKDLDTAGVQYLAKLFHEGEEHATVKQVLFGLILRRGLPKAKTTLPKMRRSLQGFDRDAPATQRDPPPEESIYLLAEDMLLEHTRAPHGNILSLMSTAAMLVQLDVGGRPSETLALTRDKVLEPQGRKFPRYAVMFQPSPDAPVETGARQNVKPSKQGTFDDTVFSGMDGQANNILSKILAELRRQARPGEALFAPLTIDSYERQIKSAVLRTGLTHMDICPHGFRHAMASKALLHKLLNQKELMIRLRVSQPATVRRYGKDGKLQRQMTILGREKRLRGEALIAGVTDKTNPAMRLLTLLKQAKTLRLQRGL
jgi:integrase